MKKNIFCFICCFIFPLTLHAQPSALSGEMIEISNEIMLEIYHDILANKSKFPEIKDFSDQALKKNQYGVYSIDFPYRALDIRQKMVDLGFGLTIVPMNARNFQEYGEDSFNYGFPLLFIKFAGYQKKGLRSDWFDINDVLQRHGLRLWQQQQKFLPFELMLKPAKERFKVGESIEFTVVLKNKSRKNLIVKDLNKETLFFVYNGRTWGTNAVSSDFKRQKQHILEPGASISQKFLGNGFPAPQEIEIYCSYIMTHEGVKPEGTLKVTITDNK